MTPGLLDTDVIGNVVEPEASVSLANGMSKLRDDAPVTATPTVADIRPAVLDEPAALAPAG